MFCRITDMHDKEVINVCDGTRIGCVDDVEVDTCTAQLVSIVVHGPVSYTHLDVYKRQSIFSANLPLRLGSAGSRR